MLYDGTRNNNLHVLVIPIVEKRQEEYVKVFELKKLHFHENMTSTSAIPNRSPVADCYDTKEVRNGFKKTEKA